MPKRLIACLMVLALSMSARACVGSRPWGMGGAFVAVADDGAAVYWNPAGLIQLQDKEVQFTATLAAEGGFRYRNFLAYTEPDAGFGAGGISWIQSRTPLGGVYTDDHAFVYSYARELADDFALGLNVRYERRLKDTKDRPKASGYSVDIGALFPLGPGLQAGFLLQDVFATDIEWKDGDRVEQGVNFRPGLAWRPADNLLVAVDLYNTSRLFDEGSSLRLGGELTAGDLKIRAGADRQFDVGTVWTAGIGYGKGPWQVDYAVLTEVDDWRQVDVQQVGLTYRF
ncbi:MAG: hypothetical protein ACOX20_01830 [Limnochordia bacterium]|nr:hypothetical protein [Bacillota bacterium]